MEQENMKTTLITRFDKVDLLFYLEVALIVATFSLFLYRFLHLDSDLIYKGSWGESQYAMYAKAYIQKGFFWGSMQVDSVNPFVNYIPIASLVTAFFVYLFHTDIVLTGRGISFFFSVLSAIYFYRLSYLVFSDRLKAAVSLFVFTIIPINMYTSRTFYNEPITFFFIILLFHQIISHYLNTNIRYYNFKIYTIFLVILISKPTLVFICGIPLAYYFITKAIKRNLDYKEFASASLSVVSIIIFIGINRYLYPGSAMEETGKIIDKEVLVKFFYYFYQISNQYLFEFQWYIILYIIGFVLAIRSVGIIRFFIMMSIGSFIFVLLFLKGAINHQYYSLPFVLPFSIIVTYAIFYIPDKLKKRYILYVSIIILLLAIFSPSHRTIKLVFQNTLPKDILYIVDWVKRDHKNENILIMGGGQRVFQYYLDIPSRYINSEQINRSPKSLKDYLSSPEIDVIILSSSLWYNGKAFPSLALSPHLHDNNFKLAFRTHKYNIFSRQGEK